MRSFSARVFLATLAFLFFHVLAVPLLSSYGLQISHPLHELGFWEGCEYLSYCLGFIFVITLVLLILTPKLTPFRGVLVYFVSTAIGAISAAKFIGLEMLMRSTRAPEIIAVGAVLLGIILAYLLRWVGVNKTPATYNFQTSWWRSVIAGLTPAIGVALFNTHYIFRMSDFEADDMFLSLVSISSWMGVCYLIHYRTEYRRSMVFSYGLASMRAGDFSARVPRFSGGIWAPLGKLLNGAFVALQERGRLLQSMSRFMARDIVQDFTAQPLSSDQAHLKVLIPSLATHRQDLSPEALTQLLEILLQEVLDVFAQFDVELDRFKTDEILASTKLATEAALAGKELKTRLPQLNQKLKAAGLPELEFSILVEGAA